MSKIPPSGCLNNNHLLLHLSDVAVMAGSAAVCVIVSSLRECTGNTITSSRLQRQLTSLGYVTHLVSNTEVDDASSIIKAAAAPMNGLAHVVIAVHALRSGAPLLSNLPMRSDCRFIVVLGGTDINADVDDSEKAAQILSVVKSAHHVISFTCDMAKRYQAFVLKETACGPEQEHLLSKLHVIPQGLDLPIFNGDADMRSSLGLPADAFVALLPAGLRPVKDPMWAVPHFRAWHAANPRVWLVIVGPPLHAETTAKVLAECACADHTTTTATLPADAACTASPADVACTTSPADVACTASRAEGCAVVGARAAVHGRGSSGILYAGAVTRDTTVAWMRQSSVVVNFSTSEGQSCALMEAMALGCVIAARRNDGNAALLEDGLLGRLYDTPESLVEFCDALFRCGVTPELEEMTARAKQRVQESYSVVAEQAAWKRLLQSGER